MSDFSIRVENLGKQYRLGSGGGGAYGYRSFRDTLSDTVKAPFRAIRGRRGVVDRDRDLIWAVQDVSFEVNEGEVIGVIGRNGAGKSTLLKMLARITEPTKGHATIRGRIGSLLEVGTGFHPELTGRENVYLNGAVLGMRKSEIRSKFDEIVAFSGVENFIDTPVKRYSSGMYVRLAFSVAAHLDTEILLVDEVLAVGDAEFRSKCLGKMKHITGAGRTILFVSHNMAAIRGLCPRVLLLDQGRLVQDSEPEEAISRYLDRNLSDGAVQKLSAFEGNLEGVILRENPTVRLLEIALTNEDDMPSNTFLSDEKIRVSVEYECLQEVSNLRLIVQAVDDEDRPFLSTQNWDDESYKEHYRHQPGRYKASCDIPANTFGGRRFYISIQLIHPKVEHLILKKVTAVEVRFQGYNGYHDAWEDTFLRPHLEWCTQSVTDLRED